MRGVKTKVNSRWKRGVVFVFLALALSVFVHSVRNVYLKKVGAEEALSKMQEEKKSLENRKDFLESSIERLSTPEGVDFEIRTKLNVAEAGESVAIIVAQEETDRANPSDLSAWQQIKLFFTKLFE